jgi:hypothetical protein
MKWMSIFEVHFLMGNSFLLIDCCHRLLGRLRKEKGQVFLAIKLSV